MRYRIVYLFALIVAASSAAWGGPPTDPAARPTRRQARRNAVVKALEKVGPAVVNISTEKIVVRRDPFHRFTDPFFEDAFRFPFARRVPVRSLGSGVIVDPRGYILTNEHVVRRASKITISLPDESTYVARRVSEVPKFDLALLKIDADEPLPFIPLGTTEDAMIGETVISIGNPFGYQNSVTDRKSTRLNSSHYS